MSRERISVPVDATLRAAVATFADTHTGGNLSAAMAELTRRALIIESSASHAKYFKQAGFWEAWDAERHAAGEDY